MMPNGKPRPAASETSRLPSMDMERTCRSTSQLQKAMLELCGGNDIGYDFAQIASVNI